MSNLYANLHSTHGGVGFDSTPDVYDHAVVSEYLGTSGQRGGPLVTSTDETQRGDFRLYNSDKNATMKQCVEMSCF